MFFPSCTFSCPAQTNRIGEPKAAAKILSLAPRIKKITDDDRRRLEAQNTIKRKREERDIKRKKRKQEDEKRRVEKQKWAKAVEHITPVLVEVGKTREGKVSTFP